MSVGRRIAYLDAQGGLAGDMFLGAALDAGLDVSILEATVAALKLDGVGLKVERVSRQEIGAVHVTVEGARETEEQGHHHGQGHGQGQGRGQSHGPTRRLPEVERLLAESRLEPEISGAAAAAFRRLAEVEGHIHGCAPEEVHFHEVGAVDALVDITGAFVAVRALGVAAVYGSPVPLGAGTVPTAHGVLPVPAPATLALLEGWPVIPGGGAGELVTPTGALVLRQLAGEWRPCPPLRPLATGYGAGTRDDPGRANVARLVIGEELTTASEGLVAGAGDEEVVVLEANVDDMSPEWGGYLIEALLAAGARDATLTPLIMKKGRPGWAVLAVADPERAASVARVFLKESTTLGLRYRRQRRVCLERRFVEVPVGGESVRVKVGYLGDERMNLAPEYEDCRRVAALTGLALKEVYAVAQAEARRQTLHNRSERS
jgi:hypothetical protein